MPTKHGVYTTQAATGVSTPSVADSGIPFVVGAAPVQSADNYSAAALGLPVLCTSFAEAKAALGYSDDFASYDLCEVMYTHFQLFGCQPVILCNMLNPATMKAKGELQALVNNNGADAANSQGVSSIKWMAINADDGSYITPAGNGTTANSVKMDWISNHLRYSKSITVQAETSRSCGFGTIDCDSTIGDAAKLVLQCLGMLPYKSTDLCPKAGHLCWFNNGADERAFLSGGHWNYSSYGLASFDGHYPRSSAWTNIGFRAAFVKLPTA